ncbi:MAG: hypothetical protein WCK02_08065 [Bacteroidota bacterium]
MKPIKKLSGVSIWLMRLGILLFAFAFMGAQIKEPQFTNPDFWLSFIFIIGAVLLFAGSLAEGPNLTVWGGLTVSLASLIKIGISYPNILNHNNALMLLMLAVGMFFISLGK